MERGEWSGWVLLGDVGFSAGVCGDVRGVCVVGGRAGAGVCGDVDDGVFNAGVAFGGAGFAVGDAVDERGGAGVSSSAGGGGERMRVGPLAVMVR